MDPRRVFHRLVKEVFGFNCSYRTVASYYAAKHKELFIGAKGGFLPLEHRLGEAQVDFGVLVQKLKPCYTSISEL
jgi:hypothetical protein